MSWSDAELERLGSLIDAGMSSRKIAQVLRRPSGTVQGEAWRLGWSFGRPRTEEEKLTPTLRAAARAEARRLAALSRPEKRTVRKLTIMFDADAYEDITARAAAERLSRAQIVRELVEWGFEAVQQGEAR